MMRRRELNVFGVPKGKKHWRYGRSRYYGKLDWDEWYDQVIAPLICMIVGHKKPKQKMYCVICPRCCEILEPR